MLIFVTGGVRSGKSTFAERLAIEKAGGNSPHYIATSKGNDHEMADRIARHQQRRNESGVGWVTWEVDNDLAKIEKQIERDSVILLDCLTTFLNNALFRLTEDNGYRFLGKSERERLFQSFIGVLGSFQIDRTLIIVSNEIFYDVPVKDETTIIYTAMLGKLHQKVVEMADAAFLCENGIPIQMKGSTEVGNRR